MSRIVTVRNMKLGEGLPKICVPLTDTSLESLIRSARALSGTALDFVEWRADFYDGLTEPDALAEALATLREQLGDIPILFTIRTKEEGGAIALFGSDYLAINHFVIQSGLVDLVDVELSKGPSVMQTLVEAAHQADVKVISSKHNFQKTPVEAEIVEDLCAMQAFGADLAKYAVMPNCERDVLTLLSASLTMKESHPDTPIITMSMGALGAVSRVCGSLTGSAVTFGTVGQASAPGQLPTALLREFLHGLQPESM